jgi:hypothetical protein
MFFYSTTIKITSSSYQATTFPLATTAVAVVAASFKKIRAKRFILVLQMELVTSPLKEAMSKFTYESASSCFFAARSKVLVWRFYKNSVLSELVPH